MMFSESGKRMLNHIYFCFQEAKDLKMKADMVKRLMDRGYRVKVLSSASRNALINVFLLSTLADYCMRT